MPGAGRLGDKANVNADAHGCPLCPHTSIGPATQGSADVMVNGRPALRVDDIGRHAPCCGPSMWTAQDGAPTVKINGKKAFRMNDPSHHCGGMGKLIEGSTDVIVGDGGGGGGGGGGSGGSSGSSGSSGSGSASSSAASSAATSAAAASSSPAPGAEAPITQDTLVIELAREDGTPISSARYQVKTGDGRSFDGTLDGDGRARIDGLTPGDCQVSFPEIDGKEWTLA